jgi:RNA polymerase sigma-70 factor (sigma-E family)
MWACDLSCWNPLTWWTCLVVMNGGEGSDSFEEFVAARWSRLVRSAVLLGADLHAAEDLTQTVLARCHRSWAKVRRARDLDAYVHRMLINVLRDSRRRRWWGEAPSDRLPDTAVDDHSDELSSHDLLRAALTRLPLGQRQVVVLRFWADLTERQTAEVLDIAIGTVKSRAARALAALESDPDLEDLRNGAGS